MIPLRSYANTGFESDENENPDRRRDTKLDDVTNGHVRRNSKASDDLEEEKIQKVTIFEIVSKHSFKIAVTCTFQ